MNSIELNEEKRAKLVDSKAKRTKAIDRYKQEIIVSQERDAKMPTRAKSAAGSRNAMAKYKYDGKVRSRALGSREMASKNTRVE